MSPANDSWEALLSTHATLIKEFGTEDIWAGLSMREYRVSAAELRQLQASQPPMNPRREPDSFRLVVVSAGASDPSSTWMLADRIAERVTARHR